MPNFNRKLLFFLLLPLSVILSAAYLFIRQLQNPPLPTLLNSDPTQNAQNVDLFAPIVFKFSSPLTGLVLTASSQPSLPWDIQLTAPDTLTLSHSLALTPSTDYEVTLNAGSEIITTLSFTTQNAQGDPGFVQRLRKEMLEDFPLADHVPYETAQFLIYYTAPHTLQIDIKNPTLSPAQAIGQVKSWVNSYGLAINSHQYSTASVPPSPSSTPEANQSDEELVPPAGPVDPLYY